MYELKLCRIWNNIDSKLPIWTVGIQEINHLFQAYGCMFPSLLSDNDDYCISKKDLVVSIKKEKKNTSTT